MTPITPIVNSNALLGHQHCASAPVDAQTWESDDFLHGFLRIPKFARQRALTHKPGNPTISFMVFFKIPKLARQRALTRKLGNRTISFMVS